MQYTYQIISGQNLLNLQKCEVDILKCVVSIIEKHNLKYFAVGGTALGAKKYSGFIPWDDDIDIAMPRDDYMAFLKIAKNELSNDFEIDSIFTNKKYYLGVTKVRDKRTSYFDVGTASYNVSHGVFIDIFPIDHVSEFGFHKSIFFKMREQKIWFLNPLKGENTLAAKIKGLFSSVILFFCTPHHCAEKNERILIKNNRRFSKSKTVYMRIENHKSEWFSNYEKLKFCNIEIRVPYKVNEYLEKAYGNIKIDPPETLKKAHHYCLLMDLNKSYTKYKYKKGLVSLK